MALRSKHREFLYFPALQLAVSPLRLRAHRLHTDPDAGIARSRPRRMYRRCVRILLWAFAALPLSFPSLFSEPVFVKTLATAVKRKRPTSTKSTASMNVRPSPLFPLFPPESDIVALGVDIVTCDRKIILDNVNPTRVHSSAVRY